jgi:hypothetical protein
MDEIWESDELDYLGDPVIKRVLRREMFSVWNRTSRKDTPFDSPTQAISQEMMRTSTEVGEWDAERVFSDNIGGVSTLPGVRTG